LGSPVSSIEPTCCQCLGNAASGSIQVESDSPCLLWTLHWIFDEHLINTAKGS
jgi:hypothetical protein